jgi:hypothetical protein
VPKSFPDWGVEGIMQHDVLNLSAMEQRRFGYGLNGLLL